MIKIFVGLCSSVSNHLLLKMQIIKVLNPHSLSREELLFVIFVRCFYLKFSWKCFIQTFKGTHGCSLASLYSGCDEERHHCLHKVFFLCQYIGLLLSKHYFTFFGTFVLDLILFRIH